MKINWIQVYEGWRNKLIPPAKLKNLILQVSEERTAVCEKCEHHSSVRKGYKTLRLDRHCIKCGCTISAKVSCLSCNCPLNPSKWEAVVTEKQEEDFNNNK